MKNKDLCKFEKIIRLLNRDNSVHLQNITTIRIKRDEEGASILLEDEEMNSREYFELSKERYNEIYNLKWEEK